MNAPFAWPTKYPLPQYRSITRVAIGGLGVLLASCSDGLSSPGERSPASVAPPGIAAADIVVMERTTTDASRIGQTPVVHTSREVLTPQMRIAGRNPTVRTLPAAPDAAPRNLPRPPLSLPARREVAICNALSSWTDRSKGATGNDLLLSGVADAPASTMKVVQDDGSVWTVERKWTRTATSWQLDRQVTKGSHGYEDVITYHHQNALGAAVNNALPVASCAGQQQLAGPPSAAASHSFYPAYSGALYSKLVPGSGVSADDGCWDLGGDPCYDKRMSVYRSDIALIAVATGMTLACVTPLNVVVITCLGATTLYFGAIANLAIDQAALQHCLQEASKPKGAELSVGRGSAPALATAPAHASFNVAVIGATTLKSCGSGSDGSSSALHCHWDTWEISYDGGETWEFFASFLICDNAS
jgi:hypothetical protein